MSPLEATYRVGTGAGIMEVTVHRQIANEIITGLRHLGAAVELSQTHLSSSERAKIVIPIGNAVHALTQELLPELVKRDPSLTDIIHPSIPLGGWPHGGEAGS
jgi:hypothetical protein